MKINVLQNSKIGRYSLAAMIERVAEHNVGFDIERATARFQPHNGSLNYCMSDHSVELDRGSMSSREKIVASEL